MNSINERSFYFYGLAAWAKGVGKIIDEGRLGEFTKEFEHDAKAHAAKLIAEAELLLHSQKPNSKPEIHNCSKPFVSSSKRFKCRNCGARSTNSGAFYKGSNVYKDGQHCYKCEKAWAEQNAEDNSWYNSVRM